MMPAFRVTPVRSNGIITKKASIICLFVFVGISLISLNARLRLLYGGHGHGGGTEYQQQLQKRPSASITELSPNHHLINATATATATDDGTSRNHEHTESESTPPVRIINNTNTNSNNNNITDQSQSKNNNTIKHQDDDDADADFPVHYTVFSTGCSKYQDWQSLMFFHSAYRAQQPGHVIRIASGCRPHQQETLRTFHQVAVSKLSPGNFHIHFTPDFSGLIPGDSYMYYNKPYGVQHWLEHGLQYAENRDRLDDAIFMVLDPDMIFLRPLTYDFTNSNVIYHGKNRKKGIPTVKTVSHGQPWASMYAMGNDAFKQNLTHIFANYSSSPAMSLNLTLEDQLESYQVGPPYMATGRDFFAITNLWCELVVKVREVYDKMYADMLSWSLATAHLELPQVIASSLMVSDIGQGSNEGWPLIDALGQDDLCEYSPARKEHVEKLPYILHYCQNYFLGDWFVSKYGLEPTFFSCAEPLALEPPHVIEPGGEPEVYKKGAFGPMEQKRHHFMVCQLIARFNDAASWFKDATCDNSTLANSFANYTKLGLGFRWSNI